MLEWYGGAGRHAAAPLHASWVGGVMCELKAALDPVPLHGSRLPLPFCSTHAFAALGKAALSPLLRLHQCRHLSRLPQVPFLCLLLCIW